MARVDRMVREFAVEVEWVPFELHSDTPPEGEERDKSKRPYPPGYRERLYALAQADGLPMQSNTVRANGHKALEAAEWARSKGRDTFDAVHRALFRAYFADAKNISTSDQVIGALDAAGVEVDGLRAALDAGAFRAQVDEYTQLARQNGISSTPTFIFEDRFIVPGAQDWAVFQDVLTRLGVPRRDGLEPAPEAPPEQPLIAPDDIG